MKKIIIALLCSPYLCFAAHPMLEEAKACYNEGKYQEAYERYSRFDFYCYKPQLEDHFNSFIGKAACEKKMGYEKAFFYNWSLVGDLLVGEFDDEVSEKIGIALKESLYMQVHDELVGQRQ